jgi:hypothetical protein
MIAPNLSTKHICCMCLKCGIKKLSASLKHYLLFSFLQNVINELPNRLSILIMFKISMFTFDVFSVVQMETLPLQYYNIILSTMFFKNFNLLILIDSTTQNFFLLQVLI